MPSPLGFIFILVFKVIKIALKMDSVTWCIFQSSQLCVTHGVKERTFHVFI